jgi:hypothetical protein
MPAASFTPSPPGPRAPHSTESDRGAFDLSDGMRQLDWVYKKRRSIFGENVFSHFYFLSLLRTILPRCEERVFRTTG